MSTHTDALRDLAEEIDAKLDEKCVVKRADLLALFDYNEHAKCAACGWDTMRDDQTHHCWVAEALRDTEWER